MSRKKLIIISIALSIGMTIVAALMIWIDVKTSSFDDVTAVVVPTVESADAEYDYLNLSLWADTLAEDQVSLDDYMYRVYVSNPEELYNSSLPPHGYGTFEGYLSRYINYYVPGNECYEVQYIKGSDDFYTAYTDFLVKIPELDVKIRCIYKNSEQRYDFISPLSEKEN